MSIPKNIGIVEINGRKIALKGVGKMFYEHGVPIPVSIDALKKKGIEVSILHVADECLKNGWQPKTVVAKFREDFADSGSVMDDSVEEFCYLNYDLQREMIFKTLFESVDPKKWLVDQLVIK